MWEWFLIAFFPFDFIFSLFFSFRAVRSIKLAISFSSAFERMLIYRIVSYRIVVPVRLVLH